MGTDMGGERFSTVQVGEKANDMDLFGCGQFHAGEGEQAMTLCRFIERTAVAAGVVIGQSDDVQSCQSAHPGKVGRSIVCVAAGRQAAVQMEVECELQGRTTFREKSMRNCRPPR